MKLLIYLIFITLMGFSSNNLSAETNPNNGHFTLYFGDEMEKNIQIFNIQGLKVFETNTTSPEYSFDGNRLSVGMYVIKIHSEIYQKQIKLIIYE